MLGAARDAFVAHGYAGATMPGIAAAAGTSVETVYKVFGNKAALVKAVFDVTIAGDDEPIPLRMRATIQAIEAEPDPQRKLAMYGRHVGEIGSRIGPLLLAVRAAAEQPTPGRRRSGQAMQAERLARDDDVRRAPGGRAATCAAASTGTRRATCCGRTTASSCGTSSCASAGGPMRVRSVGRPPAGGRAA